MPSLKDLKTRINSVKSTQKITSAMKMVAAAKLRRAQDSAEKGRPYADRMQQIVNSLASKADPISAPQLLVGNGKARTTPIFWWSFPLIAACAAASTVPSPARPAPK